MTDRYVVIGFPIAHSLSPAMQAAAFRAAALDASYDKIEIEPSALENWLISVAPRLDGFNVTIPHKRAIAPHLDEIADDAAVTGAVNTVVRRGDRLTGFNTDVAGFDQALGDAAGENALVFGSGGAARAVVLVLRRRGMRVTVVSRSHPPDIGGRAVNYDDPALLGLVASADLLVNATPLGMAQYPHSSPLPVDAAPRPGALAFDLVYGRPTPFLQQAQAAGCETRDGLEMLVRQGAAAFRLWTGLDPAVDVMRAACLDALKEAACSVS